MLSISLCSLEHNTTRWAVFTGFAEDATLCNDDLGCVFVY